MAIPLSNVLFNDGLAVDVNRLAHPLFMRYVKTSCNIDRFLNIIAAIRSSLFRRYYFFQIAKAAYKIKIKKAKYCAKYY